jgi:sialate O-acetylesterase
MTAIQSMRKTFVLPYSSICMLGSLFLLAKNVQADVVLPAILSDHAVLQKSGKTTIWGKADPEETVSVQLAGVQARATADVNGNWLVHLDLLETGQGPHDLLVEGKNKIARRDIMLGEVWVCSGQSNMNWPLKETTGGPQEAAQANHPGLRLFLVKRSASMSPKEECDGQWVVSSPETAGQFTAVGYYFGKALNQRLKIPVGLIQSTWGGTRVEAWTSGAALDKVPKFKLAKELSFKKVLEFPERKKQFSVNLAAWMNRTGREDRPVPDPENYHGPDVDLDHWEEVTLPGGTSTLPGPGAFWMRKEIVVPAHLEGKKQDLRIDYMTGMETVYWNGHEIGKVTLESYPGNNAPRRYTVPAQYMKSGKAVIALRVFSPLEPASVTGQIERMTVGPIVLGGHWRVRKEYEFARLAPGEESGKPDSLVFFPGLHTISTCLFNDMIHPLVSYTIKGVVWYQGESNADKASDYRNAFPLMIRDWRNHWGLGDFPFYFCQLPGYDKKENLPGENDWADLREAQTRALDLPQTAMAVLIDLGEAEDIHPRDKKDVGHRLAKIALARSYHQDVAYAGPVYRSMSMEGNAIRIFFESNGGGLVAKPLLPTYWLKSKTNSTAPLVEPMPGSPVQGFAICGQDRQWKWAIATIEGESVRVSSPEVEKPLAVRYAWAGNPTCNLYNKAGLPAGPFRTDVD